MFFEIKTDLCVDNRGTVQYDDGNHTVDFHEILGILQRCSEVLLKRLQVVMHFGRNHITLLKVLQTNKKEVYRLQFKYSPISLLTVVF